ncbi:MAG TPA: ANTAR domain-containing protein [Streptosporangiaceae bacterium]
MTSSDIAYSDLHAAVDNAVEGVFFGAPDGRVFYANPAGTQLLRGSSAELTAAGHSGVCDLQDPVWQSLFEARRRHGWVRGRAPMVRLDGTHFVGEVSSAIFRGADGEERSCWIVRDVTTMVRTERRLLAYEAIAEALLAGRPATDVLALMARHACAIFDAVLASILTPDDGGQGVVMAAAHGKGAADLVGHSFPLGVITEKVMTDLRPLLVDDVTLASRTDQVRSMGMGPGMMVPILAGEATLGALFIGTRSGRQPYDEDDLADAAKYAARVGLALSLDGERSERERQDRLRAEQLQRALESRVVIEQAKGFIARTHGVGTEEGFDLLRKYARSHKAKIHDVARQVVERKVRI